MIDIKLIASDVDGTLLPYGGAISDATRRAVRRCRERGIPFVIASGRWIGALGDVVDRLGARGMPLLIANGAAVIGADGAPLREWLIPEADARRVYGILRGFDVQINGYARNALYCVNTEALRRQSTMIRDYIGGRGYTLVAGDAAAFEAEALPAAYKLEALTEDPALIAEVRAALSDVGLAVTHSSGRNVEIMARGAGKGAALRWLAGELGIDTGRCMAFGDNANDIDLLSAVGWPVAVGNATAELKAVARLVAPDDADDGVAKVIFKEVLGEAL